MWKWVIIGAYALINLIAFILMRYDKRCAIRNRWRVPEKTLFIVAGCFGGVGGTLGMYFFRHKTKHWYFKIFFPLMAIIQLVLLYLIFSRI